MFYRPSTSNETALNDILKRFIAKDPAIWSDSPEIQDKIKLRLGWLDVLPLMEKHKDELKMLANEIKARKIQQVILLGMGGSSLCAHVLAQVFGPGQGSPALIALDTTDPDEIEKIIESGIDDTLFILASKSGSTLEPNAQFAYFWSKIAARTDKPGEFFIAITDPGTSLEKTAREKGFWKVFLNPADIGGRNSALSFFGLVPAAILGLDIDLIVASAKKTITACLADSNWLSNPGARLTNFLAEYTVQNRDKLTIMADDKIKPFGLWLEQLIAESTGKETRGIVPIIGESTGIPGFYGAERIFVYLRLKDTEEAQSFDAFFRELRDADFPCYEIVLDDIYDLWGQFFLWEMATALSSHFLAVNPFDEPDVALAKQKTALAMETFKAQGGFQIEFIVDQTSQFQFRSSEIASARMKGLSRSIRDMLQIVPTWGFVGFLPYLPYDPEVDEIISEMRHLTRQERGCATTIGYGPRYLHSTGQLHKGGPMNSAFFIFTRKKAKEYEEIPGIGCSFWHLQFAQACGDFDALSELHRRVIHLHLASDYKTALRGFSKLFIRAIKL